MQYLKPFKYFAGKSPGGWRNVGIGCICSLVPIAGQIVWFGYRAEVNDDLEHDPALERYTDFNVDRLMPYLQRGAWPFVTNLIVGLAVLFPAYILSIILGFLILQSTGEILFAALAYIGIFSAAIIGMNLMIWPMELHAMKTRKLHLGAELKFAWQFLRVIGLETAVSIFLFNMLGQILLLLGLLCCLVGIYPAAAIYTMAEQHIMLQLYQRYIEEGGKPIDTWSEFEEDSADDAPRPKARRAEPEIE
jgi:hypothetical protein